jgi:hypothetical protein
MSMPDDAYRPDHDGWRALPADDPRYQHGDNLAHDAEHRNEVEKHIRSVVAMRKSAVTAGHKVATDRDVGLAHWDLEVLIAVERLNEQLYGGLVHNPDNPKPGCSCPACTFEW